jgi:hypothetical protein
MTVRAQLDTLVEALQLQSTESAAYFDIETGEVQCFESEVLEKAEAEATRDRELPEWQRSEIASARRVLAGEGKRYLALPSSRDVHEWRMMEAFCLSIGTPGVRDDLLAAIHARGAFRNFGSGLVRHRLRESWFEFRDAALRKIAIAWCAENEVACDDGVRRASAKRKTKAETAPNR